MSGVPAAGGGARPAARGTAPARERLDPLAVRRLLRDEGLRARHSLSQNFLADPDVLDAILVEADAHPGDAVLEIGPGLGILTGGLLADGAAVTAVELDFRLAGLVRQRFEAAVAAGSGPGSLVIIEGDALDQDLPTVVPAPYRVVANLPYHITSPILHRLLERAPRPERMVLMVQWEVAERIAAPPGRMSYLSVFVQHHATVRIARRVPAGAFEPAPAVESAVVVLEPRRPGSAIAAEDPSRLEAEDGLWAVVQAGFRERRKMIRNVLSRQLARPTARIDDALTAAGIAGDRRPQTLSVAEWIALRDALQGPPRDAADG